MSDWKGTPTAVHDAWLLDATGLDAKAARNASQPGAPGGGAAGAPPITSAQAIAMFDAAPNIRVDIRKLALKVLRPLVDSKAQTAHTEFMSAIAMCVNDVSAQAAAEKKEAEEAISIVLILGILFFAPAAEAGVQAAMTSIKPELEQGLKSLIPTLADKVPTSGAVISPAQWKAAMDAATLQGISDNAVLKFTSEFSSAQAKAVVKAGADFIKAENGKFIPTNDKYENAKRYLLELGNKAGHTKKSLAAYILIVADFDGLCGLHDLFDASDAKFYHALITKQVDDFIEQIAAPMAQKVTENRDIADEIVILDAYGAKRMAHVRYDADNSVYKTPYFFLKWVTPEMEGAAKALGPQEVDGSKFMNRIPAPDKETTKSRVVRIDCWGMPRLASVSIEDEGHVFGKTEFGKMTFVRWFDKSEISQAEMLGGMQVGGINAVDPSSVKGLRQPKD